MLELAEAVKEVSVWFIVVVLAILLSASDEALNVWMIISHFQTLLISEE